MKPEERLMVAVRRLDVASEAARRLEIAREERDRAMRLAAEASLPRARIAELTGLSVSRVMQILASGKSRPVGRPKKVAPERG